MNAFTEEFSANSKIDKKGRISIPIGLRAKLRMLEGTRVEIILRNGKLILLPYGQSGVNGITSIKASTQFCGSCRPSSIPGSGPKKGDKR